MSSRFVLAVLMIGLFSSACGGAETIQGSGNVTSESRNVSGFNEVELQGIGNLTVQQTGSESLTIEAEDNIIPYLKTEVENNRLTLYAENGVSLRTTAPISYTLAVKDLNALKVSGSGDVEAEDISTKELAITISGSGNVKMSGKADSQDVDISGSGEYQGGDLQSKEVRIDLSGSGEALVNVSDELDAEVSGSGSVEYTGDPTVTSQISGSGELRKR